MASSCVVCLGDGTVRDVEGNWKPFAAALRASLGLGDDARHTFFDRDDVTEWMRGDTNTLQAFLMD